MFKGLGNLASMMKNAQQMGERMKEVSEQLRQQKATASSGAGMVEIEINGLGEVLAVRLDDAMVKQADKELMEDLIASAVNQASAKAKQMHMDAMKGLTGGMDLPGLDDALQQITGGGGS